MKYLTAGLLSLIGIASAEARSLRQCGSQGPTRKMACSTGSAVAAQFPSVNGTMFNIDGETKYFAGTNSYWISFLTNNADVDKTLDELADSGHKILRIWGFNDVTADPGSGTVYFQRLSASGSTINTGANGLQRLDYVVSAAETRGIKLIINFVNHWDDYGGMAAYVRAFGGSKQTWYTNTAAQTQYRAYIEAVVSRYADSSALFAWELANEPRCNGCDTGVLTDWAAATSAYVKRLDPDHMVTLGDEGFGLAGDGSYPYQFTEGVDFVANLAVDTLDFATFHMYPEHWGTSNDWGNGWIQSHGAACAAAGKPCLLEEYGSTTDHCGIEGKWQKTALSTDGLASDLFWQLGTTLSSGQTHNDGFTIYVGSNEWTCLATEHVASIG
ncbi:carbohydrate-binding module family 1 [Xylariaceae sp. FL0662B]|nr:carbohydrate-binding module family 1 [Xylariaceae sp. FL0662B]